MCKDEILICGGKNERDCYSYHILKNEYKFICSYPNEVKLTGHCVVKFVESKDSNETVLLSFGGLYKHTLMLRYVSVWGNNNGMNKTKNCNCWLPLTDSDNNLISIGRDEDNYYGMRAVIGGRDNHLLFITYYPSNIHVFDLITFQFIKRDSFPTNNNVHFHCLILKPENDFEITKKNANANKANKNNIMLLFCFMTGLSIEYDEDNNSFQFHKVRVCTSIRSFYRYPFVCVDNFILFFGGVNRSGDTSILLHKYSIIRNKWMKHEQPLSISRGNYIALLSEDKSFVYMLGMPIDHDGVSTLKKTEVKKWVVKGEEQWIFEDKHIVDIEDINIDLEEMRQELDIKKLKLCDIQKKKTEIEIIIEYWMHSLLINKTGWIDDFNVIILRYIL
ncbi:hypothetical protein RFI_18819, partial [Reticulomyxa filosa]